MKRWNRWGDENKTYPVSEGAKERIEDILGPTRRIEDISIEDAIQSVPDSNLPDNDAVSIEPEVRLRHACGQSLPDWINLNSGRISNYPDGVAYPSSDDEIRGLLDYARSDHLVLIPYGGGTSVLGHINPPAGDTPILTVDLSNLDQLLNLDKSSQLAEFEAGANGPQIEKQLNKHGFTFGHYPQSFEYSTLGGWIATRSSGQQSQHFGRIEDLFRGGHIESPQGPIDLSPFPASAAGPDLRHLFLGSEGRFGFITRAQIAIQPLPEFEAFYGLFFKDWEGGVSAVREIVQKDLKLSMIRISDPQETEITLLLSGHERLIQMGDIALRRLSYKDQRCLMIIGLTGQRRWMTRYRSEAIKICRRHGALHTGKFIGDAWCKSRFLTPYLRNTLWDLGFALDTLETATTWNKVQDLKDEISTAIFHTADEQNKPVLLFGHISHSYRTGASIYMTYIFKRSVDPDENLEFWKKIKQAASWTILEHGGTISHHHGVGHDHASYLIKEKGDLGFELLSTTSKILDPNTNFNQDVLIPKI